MTQSRNPHSKLSVSEEWDELSDSPSPNRKPEMYSEAMKRYNRPKNRYSNILPLEKTRVFKTEGPYVNANIVNVGKNQEMIITQAPLRSTVSDFWWMVWHYRVPLIAMFTDVYERNRKKSEVYWPQKPGESIEILHGIFTLKNISMVEDGNFIITRLRMCVGGGEEVLANDSSSKDIFGNNTTHDVLHYHYKGWPDFGVPNTPHDIIRFLKTLADNYTQNRTPVIVHCSAGVGRSGVICAIYRALQTQESIFEAVNNIRKYRKGLVQTKDQYRFLRELTKKIFT